MLGFRVVLAVSQRQVSFLDRTLTSKLVATEEKQNPFLAFEINVSCYGAILKSDYLSM